jgi:hypothetical protein
MPEFLAAMALRYSLLAVRFFNPHFEVSNMVYLENFDLLTIFLQINEN